MAQLTGTWRQRNLSPQHEQAGSKRPPQRKQRSTERQHGVSTWLWLGKRQKRLSLPILNEHRSIQTAESAQKQYQTAVTTVITLSDECELSSLRLYLNWKLRWTRPRSPRPADKRTKRV